MDRRTTRSSRFIFASASGSASTPSSPVVASPRHWKNADIIDDDQLTSGLRYESHRPRTPPKQVSHLGPGASGNGAQGKGIKAARSRGALADLFPEAAAHQLGGDGKGRNGKKQEGEAGVDADDRLVSDYLSRDTSHELSLSPRGGRDGVVDQMLQSFDQLEDSVNGNSSTIIPVFYADPDRFDFRSRSTSGTRRPRGHTYSSSTSSGIAAHTVKSPHQRGAHHRKQSSSNILYLGNRDRINSPRTIDRIERRPSTQGAATARQRPDSKGAVVPGIDESRDSKLFSPRRRQQARRSTSFDQGYVREYLTSSAVVLRDPVTMAEYDDLNAAPEPSVRPGPRRLGEAASVTSVRGRDGGKTLTGLRKQGVSPQRMTGLDVSIDDSRNASSASLRDGQMQAPPISSQRQQPPTNTGYNAVAFSTNGRDTGKEKGGFFKRMFGGGKPAPIQTNNSHNSSVANLPSEQPTQNRGREVASQEHEQSSVTNPPDHSTDAHQTPPKSRSEHKEPQTLNKKSSFFRRRKKSIAAPVPEVPTIPSSATWSHAQRDPSPASSLRKVMNPYIGSRPGTRAGGPGSRAGMRIDTGQAHDNTDAGDGDMVIGTLATPRAVDATRPRQSTSKTRAERPPTGRRGDSYKSSRAPSRHDGDASETSDVDFISAKSHVNSPVEDSRPDMFRPPAPSKAPPAVPTTTDTDTDSNVGKTATRGSAGIVVASPDEDAELMPTDEDYEVAYKLFRFKPENPPKEPGLPTNEDTITPWLGEMGSTRARVRKAYLDQFDWREISLLSALRKFCEHVRLKGETQQVDRILEAIARRWIECNPSHSFKSLDVVHTICYSLLLLNTDLHLANIDNRMTRSQFIKNTIPTVMKVMDDTAPDAFNAANLKRTSMLPPNAAPLDTARQAAAVAAVTTTPGDAPKSPNSPNGPRESGTVKLTVRRNSNEFQRNKFRLSARPSDNYAIENLLGNPQLKAEFEAQAAQSSSASNDDCGPLVKQPFLGGRSAWESQLETVLKNFYNSVQKQRLPLQGSDGTDPQEVTRTISNITQHSGGTPIRRTPSIASKQSDGRGRNLESRGTVSGASSSRWASRHRNRPRLYAASSVSMDDDMSMSGMSPSASSLWSKHSFGRTQTSMSVQSSGSDAPGKEAYQQSIGFANALSQAIIREEGGAGGDETDSEAIKAVPLLEDESLELYGAPWAKEGIVKHKHHLEAMDKKAKERAWTECFAVIEKGWLRLFRFNSSKTASLRSRTLRAAVSSVGSSSQSVRAGSTAGGKMVVGGGNWMDNALPLGRFLLRQTIASALPPPGYSKSRPHVWALSLPSGAVHLFQAGTPEIVREYVSCANYWSARLSKEPLMGGVSNIEYGWSENLIGDLISTTPVPPGSRDGNSEKSSSIADVFNAKRQRSGSASSSATQVPSAPRSNSRGFAGIGGSRPPSAMHSARPSLQTSIRSSFETTASAVARPRLPGDHVKVADWTPPPQSMVASALLEVDQLRVLSDYVANIKRELEKHNELRSPIQQAYNPRHPNYAKAMGNFERKSAYLLREIVKFSTYVETLQNAQNKKEEVYKERDQRKKELDEMRSKETLEKVETAEELRRELSKSDLRKAAQSIYDESDDDDVPAVPDVPKALMKMIT